MLRLRGLLVSILFSLSLASVSYGYSFTVCKSDFEKLCKGQEFTEINTTKCFAGKSDKLTGQCKEYFDKWAAITPMNKLTDKSKKEDKDSKKSKATAKAVDAKNKTTAKKKQINEKIDGALDKVNLGK